MEKESYLEKELVRLNNELRDADIKYYKLWLEKEQLHNNWHAEFMKNHDLEKENEHLKSLLNEHKDVD